MKIFKLLAILLVFSFFMTGCAAYIDGYHYSANVRFYDNKPSYGSIYYYRYTDLYPVRERSYYIPATHEYRSGRCDIPGYVLIPRSGYCEYESLYYRRGPITRYHNCHRYYRGHLFPQVEYHCR